MRTVRRPRNDWHSSPRYFSTPFLTNQRYICGSPRRDAANAEGQLAGAEDVAARRIEIALLREELRSFGSNQKSPN
jgi:hypothetical protein